MSLLTFSEKNTKIKIETRSVLPLFRGINQSLHLQAITVNFLTKTRLLCAQMQNRKILHISVRYEANSFNSPDILKLSDMFTSVYPLLATPVSSETIP